MSSIILGVGDLAVSNKPGDVIKTLALGSCVAILLLDPRTRSIGMVHIALPESATDLTKAKIKPGYFADTGIPALIDRMTNLTGAQNGKGFLVKLAGGAQLLDPHNFFNIGKRNVIAIKKILWHHRMGPQAEDVGGHISRNVAVDVNTGRVVIASAGMGEWEI